MSSLEAERQRLEEEIEKLAKRRGELLKGISCLRSIIDTSQRRSRPKGHKEQLIEKGLTRKWKFSEKQR